MNKRTEFEKELIKDIRRLDYNVRRRLSTISKKNLGVPFRAQQLYDSLGKITVKGKTYKQLADLKASLGYINLLKTSTVKGALNLLKYNYLYTSVDTNKMFEIYNKLVHENYLAITYKYEVQDLIYDYVSSGNTDYGEIKEAIDKLYEQLQPPEVVMQRQITI